MTADDAEQKWAQRLDRERKARRQAEQFAEKGLRELWVANQQLEAAVSQRTSELDRSLAALDHASYMRRSVLAEMAEHLGVPTGQLSALMDNVDASRLPPDLAAALHRAQALTQEVSKTLGVLAAVAQVDALPPTVDVHARDPHAVVDELVRRWQLPTARRGKLLSPEVHSVESSVLLHWQPLIGAADAILDGAAQHSGSGSLHLVLTTTADEVVLTVTDPGIQLSPESLADEHPTPTTWASIGNRGIGLAVAQRMVAGTSCQLHVTQTDDGMRAEIRSQRPQNG